MAEGERSIVATVGLVVLLTCLNMAVEHWAQNSLFDYLTWWPIPFALAVWIAARIWNGHNSL